MILSMKLLICKHRGYCFLWLSLSNILFVHSVKGEIKLSVLECVYNTFQVSPEDVNLLCSSDKPIDINFFQSLERAHHIEKNCKVAIRSGEQNLG